MMDWMKYPDGEEVTYNYDARMMLDSVAGANTYVFDTQYDSAGRVTSRELGNGLVQNFGYYNWDETVNNVGQGGRLETLATGTLQNLAYVYDSVGNIEQVANSSASETSAYEYDQLNRLRYWTLNGVTKEYQYDSAGNLWHKEDATLEYNDTDHVHAVTDANGNSYQYDDNGNQTVREIGQDTYELKYDAENRLVEVKKNDETIALFIFDGDGRRVKSVVDGETILFVGGYYHKKGTEITKYYPGGAMRKYVIPQSMSVEYILGDHLGSASVMTDSLGNKVSEMRYSPWGEVRYHWVDSNLSTTPAYTLPKQTFTGQFSYMDDPSTQNVTEGFGLMFYQSRFYDPQVGRFTQADTIVPGGVQGLDRYAYVNNSPITSIDPNGHCPSSFAKKNPTVCGLAPDYNGINRALSLNLDPAKDIIIAAAIAVQNQYGIDAHPNGGKGSRGPIFVSGSGFGLGQITDAEMIALHHKPGDQMKPEFAIEAMRARISKVLAKCNGQCTPIDMLIATALAQNNGFNFRNMSEMANAAKKNHAPINWDGYFEDERINGGDSAWEKFRASGIGAYDGEFMLLLYTNDLIALHNMGWALPYGLSITDIYYVQWVYVWHKPASEFDPSQYGEASGAGYATGFESGLGDM